jgi:glucose-6-phosphate 1-dehydrogenase
MEPPVGRDSESIRDEKVKVLKAIPPLDPANVVRGQFSGYHAEKGVAPGSTVETFAAVKLEIHSWRWQGVPFYIRAGKLLPVTCAEVFVTLREPPPLYVTDESAANYLRFQLSPDIAVALQTMVMTPSEEMTGTAIELLACHHPKAGEVDAYERLLREAMRGDATLFAREDSVEEAWRIVDPVLNDVVPIHEYEPHTWGPPAANALIIGDGGWHEPMLMSNCP